MAKQKRCSRMKEEEDKHIENLNQIDLIPKCVQQPRTRSPGGPKRRTDFSPFFCSRLSPSYSSNRDLSPESHGSKDELTIEANHYDSQQRRKEIPSIHVILCCQSEHKGGRLSPEYSDLCYKQAESSSNVDVQKGDIERTMEHTPEKLDHGGSKDMCQTSIGGEGLICSDSDNASVSGNLPMQPRGSDESVLLDPDKSISELQAGLLRTGHIDTSKVLDKHPAKLDYSDENDQPFDKPKSSSSSQIEGDILDTGRGKRKRKPKLHFDDLMSPVESVKKGRRLKIMRHLGLTAPAGSPFILPHQ